MLRERKIDTQIYPGSLHKLKVRPVPLFSTRAFHYNLYKITLCSSTLAKDFSNAQVILNKRLHNQTLKSKNECLGTLDILSEVFTKYNSNCSKT